MKRLLLALGIVAWALPAQAQNAITQEGSVIQNSPVMFRGNNRARQGAGAGGAATGQIITTGDAVVGGRCDYSGPSDTAGGYYRLCLDAANGKITFDGTKTPPLGLSIEINGNVYGFPGAGNGNVMGPSPTTMNELISWNSATGNALRQGAPATFTGNQTAGALVDGFQLQYKNQESTDANALYIWTCVVGTCNGAANGNFDHNRIITVVPSGSQTELQTSQGIYFINKTGRPGPPYASFPVYVGQNVVGVCDADGSGCWAGNSIISDNRGQTPTSKSLRFLAGWEADFQVTSPGTWVSGFLAGGSSVAQPANAHGYGCLWLDGQARQGSVAQWSDCFSAQDGSTAIFANIGVRAADGANATSQLINMYYRDGANVRQNVSLAATSAGMLLATSGAPVESSFTIGAGAVFRAGDNGGMQIGAKTVLAGVGSQVSFAPDAGWATINVGSTSGALNLFAGATGINIPNAAKLTMNGYLNLTPTAAPATPASGWYIYTDSGDGNKLKAKASTGTAITLGTP